MDRETECSQPDVKYK